MNTFRFFSTAGTLEVQMKYSSSCVHGSILVSAIPDFSVTMEVSFCGLLLYFAGQYLQGVSSPLGVGCSVPLRSSLQREVWLGCSPTTCPACLWRQCLCHLLRCPGWQPGLLVSTRCGQTYVGVATTWKFLCKPDEIDVAVVQSLPFGDAGTALASVSQCRQPDRTLLNQ